MFGICCIDVLPGKDAQKQMILTELSEIYHSAIEPLESLYQYNVLGVNSFTGSLNLSHISSLLTYIEITL